MKKKSPRHRSRRSLKAARRWPWFALGGAALVIFLGIFFLSDFQAVGRPRPSVAATSATRVYGYRVVRAYPHDPEAFTQGLIYRDGFLYESTGLNGQSSIRKVRLESGEVVQRLAVDQKYFAEGLADWGEGLVQLTWQSNVGFLYDRASFKLQRTFAYPGEGWGLARDRVRLIMSDGSASLRFLDPATFQETGRLQVEDQGEPVTNLNELEVVRDEIYANVWQSDRIARIAPASGRVTGWIDLTGLLPEADRAGVDVMNGIAYDAARDRLFVTGKLWPKLFEIRVTP